MEKYKFTFLRKIYFLTTLVLFTCGIKQPSDIINETATGEIFVDSGSTTGNIFLDGQNTNKSTPDTLHHVPIGQHVVKTVKAGYRSIPDSLSILVEENKLISVQFELEKLAQIGYIGIETIPPRGEIFVDNQTTGQFTPDTIQVEAGNHQIKIQKNGYQTLQWEIVVIQDSLQNLQETLTINHRILLESFGNVSCVPCVDAAKNLHEFASTQHFDQFAIMEYFTNWPNPNDPFYKESPEDVNKRVMYYGIAVLPALKIGGSQSVDASQYSIIVSTYQDVLANQKTSIGLSIEKNYNNGNLEVHIEIYDFQSLLTDNQLRLFVAIVENKIHFDSAPGSNGLTDFDFVFRTFISSNEGDAIQIDSNYKILEYTLKWQDWNYSNSKVVAFIQNISSKQIIQTSLK